MRRLCVFCGSSPGHMPAYVRSAERLGDVLALRGVGVVFGGGHIGLMGVLADAALTRGGEVIGVIPQALQDRELGHGRVSALHVVPSMHERKALMASLSDAFAALPGGYGTVEEFCEVLTWSQLGFHAKPCGLLNVEGFFDPLLALFDRQVEQGFLSPEHRGLVIVEEDAERLVERLESACRPAEEPFHEP